MATSQLALTPAQSNHHVCHDRLIKHIAKKDWWHVPPQDQNAYLLRGKFYSSSFAEAEFYGRPNDAERVAVERPLVCDNASMEILLFGELVSNNLTNLTGAAFFKARFAIDAKIKKKALKMGVDSIVLMSPKGYANYLATGKIPRSIELNILQPSVLNGSN